MKTYTLKQNLSPMGYKYSVGEINEINLYEAKSTSPLAEVDKFIGGIISIPFSINIINLKSGDELLLKTKFGVMFKNYEVLENDKVIASINTKKSLGVPKVEIDSVYGKFEIKTNIMAREFEILKEDERVASIKKVTLSLKDAYEITNINFENTDLLIAIAISVDHNFHD
ncbi:LURP-one-related/scramblase family protein [Marinilactibacillus psychrotolerans]|uniref:Uncharacterized protein n=2 Tax=Marinilactibacillus psychrotolerans TaxID=191770 RepID=A0ABW8UI28_9LACT|nr:hypothetical protein [Marinilactibacillus psychrotolerans]SJN40436.1 hypothetical protein FM115_08505 [Marinilactibacillus psychrotolerans 42ea]